MNNASYAQGAGAGVADKSGFVTLPSPEGLPTREKVLSAAARVFSAKDFYHTKLEEIADVAGLGKGTIYLHFKDKNDLFISTMEYVQDALLAQTEEKLTGITSPMMRLRLAIQLWLGHFLEQPVGILSYRSYTTMLPAEFTDRIVENKNKAQAFFVALLNAIAQKFGHRSLKRPSELLAEVLLDAIIGYVSRPDSAGFSKDYPPEKYAIFLTDLILPQHEWMKEQS